MNDRFVIWAPRAQRVRVLHGDRRLETRVEPDGMHVLDEALPLGTDYHLELDGNTRCPDPRSRWQPDGVHGASRTLGLPLPELARDHFEAPPLERAVIYELHIGTFSAPGTFAGAVAHLDHLVELGITHVELMPVATFPGARGWGYDGVHLFAAHEAYGGPRELAWFVAACHARGLAVLLDVVYNHLGPDGNYLPHFGPYFGGTPTAWGPAVNLDGPGSVHVRRFLCDNALSWLEHYHLDGLRLDAVHAFVDRSAQPFLRQLAEEVEELERRLERPLVLIAESDENDPRHIRPRPEGGHGLHAVWSDDFHHALHVLLTGETHGYYADFTDFAALAEVMRCGFLYRGQHSVFRGRAHGGDPRGLGGERFVVAAQNHDQIGNRPRGERLGHLVSERRVKIAAALTLLSPFVPMLFQGEEWNASSPFYYFTAHDDPELAQAVTRGRAAEAHAQGYGAMETPDPQDPLTFQRSKLDWGELDRAPHASMLAWYRDLIRLRRTTPALAAGALAHTCEVDPQRRTFVVHRDGIDLHVNLGTDLRTLWCDPAHELVLASDPEVQRITGGLRLPPDTLAVTRRT